MSEPAPLPGSVVAEVALLSDLISPERLVEATKTDESLRARGVRLPMERILALKGFISPTQAEGLRALVETLQRSGRLPKSREPGAARPPEREALPPSAFRRFGTTMIRHGLVSDRDWKECLELKGQLEREGMPLRIGEILAAKGLVDDSTLAALAKMEGRASARELRGHRTSHLGRSYRRAVRGLLVGTFALAAVALVLLLGVRSDQSELDEALDEIHAIASQTRAELARAMLPPIAAAGDRTTARPVPPAGPLAYRWTAGRHTTYTFESQQRVEVTPNPAFLEALGAAGAPAPEAPRAAALTIDAAATLDVRTYEVGAAGVTAGFAFGGVRLRCDVGAAGAAAPDLSALTAQLEHEVLVSLTPRGRVTALRFAPTVGPEAVNFLKAWLASLQLVLPEVPGAAWEEAETDTTGAFTAAYTLDARGAPPEIAKRKTYVRITLAAPPGGPPPDEDLVRVSHLGEIVFDFDPSEGLVAQVRGNESLRIEGGGAELPVDTESVTRTRLVLAADRQAPAEVAARWAAAREGQAAMVAHTDFAPDAAGGLAQVANEIRLGDVTAEQLLADLQRATVEGRWLTESPRLFQLLTLRFAGDAAAVGAGLRMLQDGACALDAAATIASALGASGAAPAVAGLLTIAEDARLRRPVRVSALHALSAGGDPGPDAIAALTERVEAWRDAELATAASVSLGVLARQSATPPGGASLARVLEAGLGTDPVRDLALLEALGNAAQPQSVAAIRPYLERPEERLRAMAAQALRDVHSDDVAALLLDRLSTDSAPLVRSAAAAALRAHTATAVEAGLKMAVMQDGSEAVRIEALAYFVARLPTAGGAEARAVLEAVASRDPSEGVREMARAALDG